MIGSKVRLSKIARQKAKQRDSIWPGLAPEMLWDRKTSDGWLSIPRTMPLLLQIMDNLSKGKPVSATYLDLWCRAYDDSFVLAKPREMAFYAGFSGERAERTWLSRIQILKDLGFIKVEPGPFGDVSFILILSPYYVLKRYIDGAQITASYINALKLRMNEIGASDLDAPEPSESPTSTKSKKTSEPAPTKTRKPLKFSKSR